MVARTRINLTLYVIGCHFYLCLLLRFIYEATKEQKRLRSEELYDQYSSPNINRSIKTKRMGRAGHVTHMGERSAAYRILVGKPEENTPLGIRMLRWKD
jgi:hypothetical protein